MFSRAFVLGVALLGVSSASASGLDETQQPAHVVRHGTAGSTAEHSAMARAARLMDLRERRINSVQAIYQAAWPDPDPALAEPVKTTGLELVDNEVFVRHAYDHTHLFMGRIANTGSDTLCFVRIDMAFEDATGASLGTDFTYVDGTCLTLVLSDLETGTCLVPGETGFFGSYAEVDLDQVASIAYSLRGTASETTLPDARVVMSDGPTASDSSGDVVFTGTALNTGCAAAEFVVLSFAVEDAAGELLDVTLEILDGTPLGSSARGLFPGASESFSVRSFASYQLYAWHEYRISWDDYGDCGTCTYSVTPSSRSFGSGGGTGSLTVTTSAGCGWSAASNSPWLYLTSAASGSGAGTVSYGVEANTSSASRTATLTVAGQDHTVIQSGTPFTASGDLEIHYVNVQQGGSILLIGPDGTTLLVDAGDGGKGTAEVIPYLQLIGLPPAQGLDHTLASHLDADHIGGLDEVLAQYDVAGTNWYNGSSKTNQTVQAYMTQAGLTTAGAPQAIPVGTVLDLGDGATATAVVVAGSVIGFGPVAGAASNENDLSAGLLVRYGDFDYLFAGDLGGGDDDTACTGRTTSQADVETPLATAISAGGTWPLLPDSGVDVLHVNHHGSESSTNSTWMNLLQPRVALISVGAGQSSSWQLPRKDVVENVLLAQAGCVSAEPALVLQTEEGSSAGEQTSTAGHAVGDIVIRTDGVFDFQVAATGAVSQGADERAAAGLPATVPLTPDGPCQSGDTTLCLNDGRFEVRLFWQSAEASSGHATAVAMTDDTGYFWFFDQDNVEVVVKVLDGCTVNDRFWVFAAGLTNVSTRLRVRDTEYEVSREYTTAQGSPFQPVQDTSAFSTCGCIPASQCCKICSSSKACGDSCISFSYTCTRPRGCACNSWEVCD